MIRAFRRSRVVCGAIMAVSVVIAVAIWFRDQEYPVFVPMIASVLMLGIGYFSARVAGNLLANMENTRYLGYLHMELDPEKFLACYADIPGRLKPGSHAEAIYRSYLADGYAAAGNYEKALELLDRPIPAGNLALKGLYAANRCGCLLGAGDTARGGEALEELKSVVDAARLEKPELAKNLSQTLTLHQQHYNCLTGVPVDREALTDAFDRAQYNIRRLELSKVLAMDARNRGDRDMAKKQLQYLRKNGGKTCFKRWADAQQLP